MHLKQRARTLRESDHLLFNQLPRIQSTGGCRSAHVLLLLLAYYGFSQRTHKGELLLGETFVHCLSYF